MPSSRYCPVDAVLIALSSGIVQEPLLDWYLGHLESCTACCDRLGELGRRYPRCVESSEHRSAVDTSEPQAARDDIAALVNGMKRLAEDTRAMDALCVPAAVDVAPFRIVRQLGDGATATVYEAIDTELNRTVVLKVLRPDAFPDGVSREEVMAEARSLAAITHPHVMPLYQALWHDDQPVLVFPRLEGRTLQEALAVGLHDWKDALGIIRDIADALAYTHSKDIVHRDIKPSNVWLRRDADGAESPLLFDFGLAGIAAPEAGTPGYRPPPGTIRQGDGKSADVFSLLVVLFVATRTLDDVPARVRAALSRLLNAGPEDRPTAADVRHTMEELLNGRLGRRQMIGAVAATSGIAVLSSLGARFLGPRTRPAMSPGLRAFATFEAAPNTPFSVSEDAATVCGLDASGNVVVTRRGQGFSALFATPGFTPRRLAIRNHALGGMIAAANDTMVAVLDGHTGDVVASYDAIGPIQELAWSGEDDATLIVRREGVLSTATQGQDRRFSETLTHLTLWPDWSPIADGVAAMGTIPGFDTLAALLTHNTIVTWSLQRSRRQGIHRATSHGFQDVTAPPLIGWRSMDAVYVVDGCHVTAFHISPRITEEVGLPSTVSSLVWLHGDILAFVASEGPHEGHLGCMLQSLPGRVLWLPRIGERIARVDSARNRTLLVVGSADGRVMLFDCADLGTAILAERRDA